MNSDPYAIFADRREAGRELAGLLTEYRDADDAIVLALPRGGVPVAYEVAAALHLPLDVLVVRKLGVPGYEEFGFGSIASGGIRYVNETVARSIGLSKFMIDHVIEREGRELARREHLYRGDRPPPDLKDKVVIIVDDGLATGSTMRSAVRAVHTQAPKRIIAAAPVCARETQQSMEKEVDTWCICALTPGPFYAVGQWYRDFSQTTDEEVRELLENQGVSSALKAPSGA